MNDRYNPDSRSRRTQPARRRSAPRGGAAALTQVPMLVMVLLFGLVFFFFLAMKGCASSGSEDSRARTETTAPVVSTEAPIVTTVQTEPPVTDSRAPVISTEPVTTEPVTTEPVTTEPVTTVPPSTEAPAGPTMTTVDDSYFDDALFLGDSRTDGLFLYSTPGNCKHYPFPATSMTIFKIMDSADEEQRYGYASTRALLQGEKFGKIYLMFGINEVGYDTGRFAEEYRKVVEEIRGYQPDALIYIQSICYVTQSHEAKYPVFATAGIKEKNEAIKALANDVDIFYLEVNDCLNDGTDHLPEDYSGDGAHLKASKYQLWHDYLLQHAVVDEKHPWQPQPETSEGN